ncbi:MAG: TrmH family RNA methyltransferase [Rhizobiaceae bacterium]
MNIIEIDSPSDPRLEPYCNIRERDLVARDKRFVAEGKVVLQNLFTSSQFMAESVLVLESRLAGIMPVLEEARPDLQVYVVKSPVMDQIAGFHVHRGIMAIGKRRDVNPPATIYGENALVVVIAGLSNHDNVGSIFRNAAAFHADAVILDDQSCDPLYRKALRVSVGAALKVPFVRSGSLDQIVEDLMDKGFTLAALSPRGTRSITGIPKHGKRALILGSEGQGLPQSLLDRISAWSIPMAKDFDSLNVATASGIALFHASVFSDEAVVR